MKEIPLTKGYVALVDDEDYEMLSQHKWVASKMSGKIYAIRWFNGNGKHEMILMHRVILNATKGKQVDHANRDTLDNRRSNIRLCTASQNQANSRMRPDNTSGYRGVYWHKSNKSWRVCIRNRGKKVNSGGYATKEDAAMKYDELAIEIFGEFATLNFPTASGH